MMIKALKIYAQFQDFGNITDDTLDIEVDNVGLAECAHGPLIVEATGIRLMRIMMIAENCDG